MLVSGFVRSNDGQILLIKSLFGYTTPSTRVLDDAPVHTLIKHYMKLLEIPADCFDLTNVKLLSGSFGEDGDMKLSFVLEIKANVTHEGWLVYKGEMITPKRSNEFFWAGCKTVNDANRLLDGTLLSEKTRYHILRFFYGNPCFVKMCYRNNEFVF